VATLPTHATLVAATVSTVTVDGVFSNLHVKNHTASTVVYARGDGTTPVSAADKNYPVFPVPDEGTCVPTATTDGSTTVIKLISAGTPTVSILQCDCD
jgi:hypothetical protein